jgi:glucan phosphoethanolaminetransferase (alkaline phosphatase superfamily)
MQKPVFFNEIPQITKSKGFISAVILAIIIANFFIPHFTAGLLIASTLSILLKLGYFIFNSMFNNSNKLSINRLANLSILILLIGNILHFLGPEVHLLTGIALTISAIAPIIACCLSLFIYSAIAFMHSKNDPNSYFKIFNLSIKHKSLGYFILAIIFLNLLFATLALTVLPSLIIYLHTPIIIATSITSLTIPLYAIYNALKETYTSNIIYDTLKPHEEETAENLNNTAAKRAQKTNDNENQEINNVATCNKN